MSLSYTLYPHLVLVQLRKTGHHSDMAHQKETMNFKIKYNDSVSVYDNSFVKFVLANNVDTDGLLHSVATHLGLPCILV